MRLIHLMACFALLLSRVHAAYCSLGSTLPCDCADGASNGTWCLDDTGTNQCFNGVCGKLCGSPASQNADCSCNVNGYLAADRQVCGTNSKCWNGECKYACGNGLSEEQMRECVCMQDFTRCSLYEAKLCLSGKCMTQDAALNGAPHTSCAVGVLLTECACEQALDGALCGASGSNDICLKGFCRTVCNSNTTVPSSGCTCSRDFGLQNAACGTAGRCTEQDVCVTPATGREQATPKCTGTTKAGWCTCNGTTGQGSASCDKSNTLKCYGGQCMMRLCTETVNTNCRCSAGGAQAGYGVPCVPSNNSAGLVATCNGNYRSCVVLCSATETRFCKCLTSNYECEGSVGVSPVNYGTCMVLLCQRNNTHSFCIDVQASAVSTNQQAFLGAQLGSNWTSKTLNANGATFPASQTKCWNGYDFHAFTHGVWTQSGAQTDTRTLTVTVNYYSSIIQEKRPLYHLTTEGVCTPTLSVTRTGTGASVTAFLYPLESCQLLRNDYARFSIPWRWNGFSVPVQQLKVQLSHHGNTSAAFSVTMAYSDMSTKTVAVEAKSTPPGVDRYVNVIMPLESRLSSLKIVAVKIAANESDSVLNLVGFNVITRTPQNTDGFNGPLFWYLRVFQVLVSSFANVATTDYWAEPTLSPIIPEQTVVWVLRLYGGLSGAQYGVRVYCTDGSSGYDVVTANHVDANTAVPTFIGFGGSFESSAFTTQCKVSNVTAVSVESLLGHVVTGDMGTNGILGAEILDSQSPSTPTVTRLSSTCDSSCTGRNPALSGYAKRWSDAPSKVIFFLKCGTLWAPTSITVTQDKVSTTEVSKTVCLATMNNPALCTSATSYSTVGCACHVDNDGTVCSEGSDPKRCVGGECRSVCSVATFLPGCTCAWAPAGAIASQNQTNGIVLQKCSGTGTVDCFATSEEVSGSPTSLDTYQTISSLRVNDVLARQCRCTAETEERLCLPLTSVLFTKRYPVIVPARVVTSRSLTVGINNTVVFRDVLVSQYNYYNGTAACRANQCVKTCTATYNGLCSCRSAPDGVQCDADALCVANQCRKVCRSTILSETYQTCICTANSLSVTPPPVCSDTGMRCLNVDGKPTCSAMFTCSSSEFRPQCNCSLSADGTIASQDGLTRCQGGERMNTCNVSLSSPDILLAPCTCYGAVEAVRCSDNPTEYCNGTTGQCTALICAAATPSTLRACVCTGAQSGAPCGSVFGYSHCRLGECTATCVVESLNVGCQCTFASSGAQCEVPNSSGEIGDCVSNSCIPLCTNVSSYNDVSCSCYHAAPGVFCDTFSFCQDGLCLPACTDVQYSQDCSCHGTVTHGKPCGVDRLCDAAVGCRAQCVSGSVQSDCTCIGVQDNVECAVDSFCVGGACVRSCASVQDANVTACTCFQAPNFTASGVGQVCKGGISQYVCTDTQELTHGGNCVCMFGVSDGAQCRNEFDEHASVCYSASCQRKCVVESFDGDCTCLHATAGAWKSAGGSTRCTGDQLQQVVLCSTSSYIDGCDCLFAPSRAVCGDNRFCFDNHCETPCVFGSFLDGSVCHCGVSEPGAWASISGEARCIPDFSETSNRNDEQRMNRAAVAARSMHSAEARVLLCSASPSSCPCYNQTDGSVCSAYGGQRCHRETCLPQCSGSSVIAGCVCHDVADSTVCGVDQVCAEQSCRNVCLQYQLVSDCTCLTALVNAQCGVDGFSRCLMHGTELRCVPPCGLSPDAATVCTCSNAVRGARCGDGFVCSNGACEQVCTGSEGSNCSCATAADGVTCGTNRVCALGVCEEQCRNNGPVPCSCVAAADELPCADEPHSRCSAQECIAVRPSATAPQVILNGWLHISAPVEGSTSGSHNGFSSSFPALDNTWASCQPGAATGSHECVFSSTVHTSGGVTVNVMFGNKGTLLRSLWDQAAYDADVNNALDALDESSATSCSAMFGRVSVVNPIEGAKAMLSVFGPIDACSVEAVVFSPIFQRSSVQSVSMMGSPTHYFSDVTQFSLTYDSSAQDWSVSIHATTSEALHSSVTCIVQVDNAPARTLTCSVNKAVFQEAAVLVAHSIQLEPSAQTIEAYFSLYGANIKAYVPVEVLYGSKPFSPLMLDVASFSDISGNIDPDLPRSISSACSSAIRQHVENMMPQFLASFNQSAILAAVQDAFQRGNGSSSAGSHSHMHSSGHDQLDGKRHWNGHTTSSEVGKVTEASVKLSPCIPDGDGYCSKSALAVDITVEGEETGDQSWPWEVTISVELVFDWSETWSETGIEVGVSVEYKLFPQIDAVKSLTFAGALGIEKGDHGLRVSSIEGSFVAEVLPPSFKDNDMLLTILADMKFSARNSGLKLDSLRIVGEYEYSRSKFFANEKKCNEMSEATDAKDEAPFEDGQYAFYSDVTAEDLPTCDKDTRENRAKWNDYYKTNEAIRCPKGETKFLVDLELGFRGDGEEGLRACMAQDHPKFAENPSLFDKNLYPAALTENVYGLVQECFCQTVSEDDAEDARNAGREFWWECPSSGGVAGDALQVTWQNAHLCTFSAASFLIPVPGATQHTLQLARFPATSDALTPSIRYKQPGGDWMLTDFSQLTETTEPNKYTINCACASQPVPGARQALVAVGTDVPVTTYKLGCTDASHKLHPNPTASPPHALCTTEGWKVFLGTSATGTSYDFSEFQCTPKVVELAQFSCATNAPDYDGYVNVGSTIRVNGVVAQRCDQCRCPSAEALQQAGTVAGCDMLLTGGEACKAFCKSHKNYTSNCAQQGIDINKCQCPDKILTEIKNLKVTTDCPKYYNGGQTSSTIPLCCQCIVVRKNSCLQGSGGVKFFTEEQANSLCSARYPSATTAPARVGTLMPFSMPAATTCAVSDNTDQREYVITVSGTTGRVYLNYEGSGQCDAGSDCGTILCPHGTGFKNADSVLKVTCSSDGSGALTTVIGNALVTLQKQLPLNPVTAVIPQLCQAVPDILQAPERVVVTKDWESVANALSTSVSSKCLEMSTSGLTGVGLIVAYNPVAHMKILVTGAYEVCVTRKAYSVPRAVEVALSGAVALSYTEFSYITLSRPINPWLQVEGTVRVGGRLLWTPGAAISHPQAELFLLITGSFSVAVGLNSNTDRHLPKTVDVGVFAISMSFAVEMHTTPVYRRSRYVVLNFDNIGLGHVHRDKNQVIYSTAATSFSIEMNLLSFDTNGGKLVKMARRHRRDIVTEAIQMRNLKQPWTDAANYGDVFVSAGGPIAGREVTVEPGITLTLESMSLTRFHDNTTELGFGGSLRSHTLTAHLYALILSNYSMIFELDIDAILYQEAGPSARRVSMQGYIRGSFPLTCGEPQGLLGGVFGTFFDVSYEGHLRYRPACESKGWSTEWAVGAEVDGNVPIIPDVLTLNHISLNVTCLAVTPNSTCVVNVTAVGAMTLKIGGEDFAGRATVVVYNGTLQDIKVEIMFADPSVAVYSSFVYNVREQVSQFSGAAIVSVTVPGNVQKSSCVRPSSGLQCCSSEATVGVDLSANLTAGTEPRALGKSCSVSSECSTMSTCSGGADGLLSLDAAKVATMPGVHISGSFQVTPSTGELSVQAGLSTAQNSGVPALDNFFALARKANVNSLSVGVSRVLQCGGSNRPACASGQDSHLWTVSFRASDALILTVNSNNEVLVQGTVELSSGNIRLKYFLQQTLVNRSNAMHCGLKGMCSAAVCAANPPVVYFQEGSMTASFTIPQVGSFSLTGSGSRCGEYYRFEGSFASTVSWSILGYTFTLKNLGGFYEELATSRAVGVYATMGMGPTDVSVRMMYNFLTSTPVVEITVANVKVSDLLSAFGQSSAGSAAPDIDLSKLRIVSGQVVIDVGQKMVKASIFVDLWGKSIKAGMTIVLGQSAGVQFAFAIAMDVGSSAAAKSFAEVCPIETMYFSFANAILSGSQAPLPGITTGKGLMLGGVVKTSGISSKSPLSVLNDKSNPIGALASGVSLTFAIRISSLTSMSLYIALDWENPVKLGDRFYMDMVYFSAGYDGAKVEVDMGLVGVIDLRPKISSSEKQWAVAELKGTIAASSTGASVGITATAFFSKQSTPALAIANLNKNEMWINPFGASPKLAIGPIVLSLSVSLPQLVPDAMTVQFSGMQAETEVSGYLGFSSTQLPTVCAGVKNFDSGFGKTAYEFLNCNSCKNNQMLNMFRLKGRRLKFMFNPNPNAIRTNDGTGMCSMIPSGASVELIGMDFNVLGKDLLSFDACARIGTSGVTLGFSASKIVIDLKYRVPAVKVGDLELFSSWTIDLGRIEIAKSRNPKCKGVNPCSSSSETLQVRTGPMMRLELSPTTVAFDISVFIEININMFGGIYIRGDLCIQVNNEGLYFAGKLGFRVWVPKWKCKNWRHWCAGCIKDWWTCDWWYAEWESKFVDIQTEIAVKWKDVGKGSSRRRLFERLQAGGSIEDEVQHTASDHGGDQMDISVDLIADGPDTLHDHFRVFGDIAQDLWTFMQTVERKRLARAVADEVETGNAFLSVLQETSWPNTYSSLLRISGSLQRLQAILAATSNAVDQSLLKQQLDALLLQRAAFSTLEVQAFEHVQRMEHLSQIQDDFEAGTYFLGVSQNTLINALDQAHSVLGILVRNFTKAKMSTIPSAPLSSTVSAFFECSSTIPNSNQWINVTINVVCGSMADLPVALVARTVFVELSSLLSSVVDILPLQSYFIDLYMGNAAIAGPTDSAQAGAQARRERRSAAQEVPPSRPGLQSQGGKNQKSIWEGMTVRAAGPGLSLRPSSPSTSNSQQPDIDSRTPNQPAASYGLLRVSRGSLLCDTVVGGAPYGPGHHSMRVDFQGVNRSDLDCAIASAGRLLPHDSSLTLSIRASGLQGSLPAVPEHLRSVTVDLSGNQLVGPLPSSYGANIHLLSLAGNRIADSNICSRLAQLQQAAHIDISDNSFTSCLCVNELAALPKLQRVMYGGNAWQQCAVTPSDMSHSWFHMVIANTNRDTMNAIRTAQLTLGDVVLARALSVQAEAYRTDAVVVRVQMPSNVSAAWISAQISTTSVQTRAVCPAARFGVSGGCLQTCPEGWSAFPVSACVSMPKASCAASPRAAIQEAIGQCIQQLDSASEMCHCATQLGLWISQYPECASQTTNLLLKLASEFPCLSKKRAPPVLSVRSTVLSVAAAVVVALGFVALVLWIRHTRNMTYKETGSSECNAVELGECHSPTALVKRPPRETQTHVEAEEVHDDVSSPRSDASLRLRPI